MKHLFSGAKSRVDQKKIAEFKRRGLDEKFIQSLEKREQDKPFAVVKANWPAFTLFLKSLTQWRHAGMDGRRMGLDYSGVETAARWAKIEIDEDMFDRLRICEQAVLSLMAEK